jgi:hypothetical protein
VNDNTDQQEINASPIQRVARKLNEYKELLTVLVFFFGGLIWIYGFFATKEQVEETRCIMNANIEFLSNQMDYNNLSSMLLQNAREQFELEQNANLPKIESDRLIQLKIAAKEIEKKIDAANARKDDAIRKLKSGNCSS